jgi:hypothetical protein
MASVMCWAGTKRAAVFSNIASWLFVARFATKFAVKNENEAVKISQHIDTMRFICLLIQSNGLF